MPLVLGLGNPGARYARTRHNVGWWVIEELVARFGAGSGSATSEYRSWRASVTPERPLDLLMPLTFMNRSGEALLAWRDASSIDAAELLVVTDDIYLPVGFVRVRARGGSGGHRGLESVEAALGTREYPRVRVGIGAVEGERLIEHVLEEPGGDEREALESGVRLAADAAECWAREGVLAAMNKFNRRVGKEVSES